MTDYRIVVEKFQKAMFTQHDAGAAAQMYAEDAVLTDPTTPGPVKGRKAVEANLAAYLSAFPDVTAETRNLFGSGDWFAAELTMRGTNTGPLELGPGNTIPPTGKRVELSVCWIGRVNSAGLCVEDHTYYDAASLMEQLGLSGQ